MSLARLMDPLTLNDLLHDPQLVLLDCRFALDDADYGLRSYRAGHIAQARFVDIGRQLSAAHRPGQTGRHPLPTPQVLQDCLRQLGINDDSTVVLYDDNSNAFAARAWWILAWLGKRDGLYLLDGGLAAWQAAGLPLSQAEPAINPGQFQARAEASLLISAEQLLARLDDPQLTLLDARAPARFTGAQEPIDPRGGHIPGAQCAPFAENLQADGRFLPSEALRSRFAALLGTRPPAAAVAYCGSGITACHNLFALCLAGYPLLPLYAGSWSEWITDPQRPVATGA